MKTFLKNVRDIAIAEFFACRRYTSTGSHVRGKT